MHFMILDCFVCLILYTSIAEFIGMEFGNTLIYSSRFKSLVYTMHADEIMLFVQGGKNITFDLQSD